MPRLLLSQGPIAGLITFGALTVAVNAGIAAAKAGIAGFNEGIEYVPGSGDKDTVPAMLTPGERVVPAEINKRLEGIPNADLPNLLNKQDNNMMLAGLLMSANEHSETLITLMSNMGWSYPEHGEMKVNYADGRHKKRFNI